jgi:GDP-L-fucose synthase
MIKDIVGLKGGIIFDKTKPDGTLRKLLDTTLLKNNGWENNIELQNGKQTAYITYNGSYFCIIQNFSAISISYW